MPKAVSIACSGTESVGLEELEGIQGELKTLSKDNHLKLRNTILHNGFSAPIFIWKSKDTKYILDGHQRVKVLGQLRKDGYTIPPLPIVYIEAKTKKEAITKLLSIASQYGNVNKGHAEDLIMDLGVDPDKLLKEINLRGITLDTLSVGADEVREEIRPYHRTHILFSFPPALFEKLKPLIEKITAMEGVEYEQSSN